MNENTVTPPTEKITAVSFTSYIKEKYDFYKLFLPKHKPSNDLISAEELKELNALIEDRDHFEIRKTIAKRYFDEN